MIMMILEGRDDVLLGEGGGYAAKGVVEGAEDVNIFRKPYNRVSLKNYLQ